MNSQMNAAITGYWLSDRRIPDESHGFCSGWMRADLLLDEMGGPSTPHPGIA
jgi:hypothetical protein